MNSITKYLACFFLVNYFLLSQVIKPGPETSNWFFGENAFIKFDINTKQITADYSPLITEEGCSAVSDNLGNLLFYCSGETVWNRQNQVMAGGDGLNGGYSSTQASLIIQQPGENDLYYIFNTGSLGTDLYYSIVDMKKADGLGEVVSKNNVIYSGVGEKLTACYAQNRYDIWIITKDKFSHSFLSFLLTSSGINPVPVISPVQLNFDISHKYSAMGYLKFSPDGRHLASASYCNGQFELYDFDNITGLISNTVIIKVDSGLNTYGVSFSPDASLLYVTSFDYDTYLYQYDLSVWDSLAITNSRQLIADFHNGLALGAILEGLDEKLYISHYKSNYLSAIEYPNLKGSSCSFNDSAIYLNGSRTRLGLPNFAYVNSYFDSKPDPTQFDVYLWTESFSASPGDKKSLRVFAKLLKDSIILDNVGLSFDVTFEAEAFNPDITSLISSNNIKDRNRILILNPMTFTLDTNPKLLAEIPGVVLFGDKSKYEIRLDNIKWNDSTIRTFTKFGIISIIDICRTNLRHISSVANVMNITPFPAGDDFKIDFSSSEKGYYKIGLFNIQGIEILNKDLGLINNNRKVDLSFDAHLLTTGTYFVVLYFNGLIADNKLLLLIK